MNVTKRRIVLESGKYTFRQDAEGRLYADRYDEAWREFVGDKAISALFDYAVELQGVLPALLWAAEYLLTQGNEVYREAVTTAQRLIDDQKP